ncbi:hypothetical protein MLD55_08420 [Alcanivorax sp. MM125-6]|nr:hypothetical protein [Alcanivorax sp. MM125-6]
MRVAGYLVAAMLMICGAEALAQIPQAKGMGEVRYDTWRLKDEQKAQALHDAKVNAVERYVAQGGVSVGRNFSLVRDRVASSVDDYVLGYNLVSETHDKDAKRYGVVIRAELNASRLTQTLQDASAVGSASTAEKSYITFMFVARQQASVREYDDKRVTRQDTEAYVEGSDRQARSGTGIEYSSNEYRSDKSTTGGSTTRKADDVEYRVSTTEGINSTMTRVFSTGGFEVVDAAYLEAETGGLISLDALKEDYRTGNDISPETKRDAVQGARVVEVPYVAVGTLDVGLGDKDPVSGLARVFVTVSGKVLDVRGRFPKTVASVGPVQYAGTGPDNGVARNNALANAADEAAQALTAQLNARGVK